MLGYLLTEVLAVRCLALLLLRLVNGGCETANSTADVDPSICLYLISSEIYTSSASVILFEDILSIGGSCTGRPKLAGISRFLILIMFDLNLEWALKSFSNLFLSKSDLLQKLMIRVLQTEDFLCNFLVLVLYPLKF